MERKALLEELSAMMLSDALSIGEAVRFLRSTVFAMDRGRFAKLVKLSPRALANLEDDPDANPTLETLRKVFKPFGGTMGLVFPRMVEPPPLDEPRAALRKGIHQAVARNRRQPRAGRSPAVP